MSCHIIYRTKVCRWREFLTFWAKAVQLYLNICHCWCLVLQCVQDWSVLLPLCIAACCQQRRPTWMALVRILASTSLDNWLCAWIWRQHFHCCAWSYRNWVDPCSVLPRDTVHSAASAVVLCVLVGHIHVLYWNIQTYPQTFFAVW